jgi:hypothetical protein
MTAKGKKRAAFTFFTHKVRVPATYKPVYHEPCEGVAFFYRGGVPEEASEYLPKFALSALGQPILAAQPICTTCLKLVQDVSELYEPGDEMTGH